MAKFIRIDDKIINTDQIAGAVLNFDGKGGIAVHLAAMQALNERDSYGMDLKQQQHVSLGTLIYTGERAAAVTELLFGEAQDIAPAEVQKSA